MMLQNEGQRPGSQLSDLDKKKGSYRVIEVNVSIYMYEFEILESKPRGNKRN